MGADISRIRFDTLDNFAGVQLKQGAVLLDADANLQNDIVDRRMRAAVCDIVGPGAVPSTTPDAFKIDVSGGTLSIGTGRFYVNGLGAENHGEVSVIPAKQRFDPLMAEPSFADPIRYDAQPYFPLPPKLPTDGVHLVYLDVWEREVTYLERPDLVEVAVGVETSSRVQTVWQVRVLDSDVGNATCGSPDADLPGWPELIAPSTGRLTTGVFDVAPADDPCELPPTGGYRGLENQTYRIEIHDPGQPGGKATFKWSRDNASVGSRVVSMVSASELELESLGRDDVLRFNTGDWIEIIDDAREMSQACGAMARVTAIDEAARRITFTPALQEMIPTPAVFPDSTFPRARHLRVKRWDQKHKVLQTGAGGTTSVFQDLDAGASGVINVPAPGTTLLLENGVTVSFTTAVTGTKGCRAGDYWVVAARTADASVELLAEEPPRGIHHHYARLAIWAVDGGITDCRTHWPPPFQGAGDNCACTVCVTPRDHETGQLTVQMAIDKVAAAGGGTICLEVGNYTLGEPVKIAGTSSLTLVGKGVASVIVIEAAGAVLINKSRNILLDSFLVQRAGLATPPQEVIRVEGGSTDIRVERLTINVTGTNSQWAAIGLADPVTNLGVRNNTLAAPTGIRTGSAGGGAAAELIDVRIEDNDFNCGTMAIAFAPGTEYDGMNCIRGNRVRGCQDAGFLLAGTTKSVLVLDVQSNLFNVLGHGIVASLSGLRVRDNDILKADGAVPGKQCGINLVPGSANDVIGECQILGNRIQGFADAGISVTAPLRTAMIKQNQIAAVANGLRLIPGDALDQLSIENNQFDRITGSAIVAKGQVARYTATGNQIRTRSVAPAVLLEFDAGEGVFSQNECYHDGGAADTPDVSLKSATLIVGNNRLVGSDRSLDIVAGQGKFFTALGNICRGRITVGSVPLPAPWAPLNLQGVA